MQVTDFERVEQLSVWLEVHPKLDVKLIDHLWNRLHGMYLDKWTRQFPDEVSLANWQESWIAALEAKRIAPVEVNAGLVRCSEAHPVFPPTIGEFILACRPAVDYEKAFYEAQQGIAARDAGREFEYSSPAVFWAAADMNYEMRTTSKFAAVEARWNAVLDARMRQSDLPAVPPVAPALPHHRVATHQGRSAAIEVRGLLKSASDAIDHKAWQKRLQQRAEAGEPVPYAAVKLAQSAAGR